MCIKGLISVIIPVFNREKFIEDAVKSVQNQTYKNLECLVIDDGSTDRTKDIIEQIQEKDKRIKYFYQENQGVSSARNKGLDNAQGEWVAFVDSDDWIHPQMYEQLLKASDNKTDIVGCNMMYTHNREKQTFVCEKKNNPVEILDKKYIFDESYHKENTGFLATCNKIFRNKEDLLIRFDINLSMGEDHIFCNWAYWKANEVRWVEKDYYFYYVDSPNSLCKSNLTFENFGTARAYIKEYEKMKEESPLVREYIACRIIMSGKELQTRIPKRNKDYYKEVSKMMKKYYGDVYKAKYIPEIVKIRTLLYMWIPKYLFMERKLYSIYKK